MLPDKNLIQISWGNSRQKSQSQRTFNVHRRENKKKFKMINIAKWKKVE